MMQQRNQTRLVSFTVLMTIFLTVVLTVTTASPQKKPKKHWWEAGQPRFAKTDLGRVFSGSIDLRDSGRKSTLKALAIRVGDELTAGKSATVLFDTELLRVSGAIPDRFVMFNTYRDGLGGAGHWAGPPYLGTTRREPGWSLNDSFKDPRTKPNGPLPNEWAKYKGLYRNGNRTVLSYSVGPVDVLESPWVEFAGDNVVVSRTIQTEAKKIPLTVKLCDIDNTEVAVESANKRSWIKVTSGEQTTIIALIPTSENSVSLGFDGGKIIANFTTSDATICKTLTWQGNNSQAAAVLELVAKSTAPKDLTPLTTAGAKQWTETITTQGTLGEGDSPYVVDTITAPYENPYKAQMTFGGVDFFDNGDAAICTIHGDVWRVTGIDENLQSLQWHRYATGLFQPLGLKVVDNQVYVLGRDQITKLHDSNSDNEADYYECFNNDCKIGTHVHEYTVCLETDPAGNFYYVKGNNGGQSDHDGSMFKISKDGKKFEVIATGFRWPNGAGVGPNGTVTVADQQGNWVPSSRIDIIKPGGFYGYMPTHHRQTKPEIYDGPLCWIPHSVDNSCGGQVWVHGDKFGLKHGQMLHLSYGKCAVFVVLQDEIDGSPQGGVVPLGLNFLSGAMRGRFRPVDGQLYVCGLRGWQTSAGKDGCLQRVRYTGQSLNIPVGLQVHENGLLVTYSNPVDRKAAGDWENWGIEQWNYKWTGTYGSKEYSVANPKKIGHDELDVDDVYVSKDGTKVFIEVPDMQPVMQMKVEFNIKTADGKPLRNSIYHTIHEFRKELDPKTVGELVD